MAGQDVILRFDRTNPVKRSPQHTLPPIPVIRPSSSSSVNAAAHTSSAAPTGNVIFRVPQTSSTTSTMPTTTSYWRIPEDPTMTPEPSPTASISTTASSANSQAGAIKLSPLALGLIIGVAAFLVLFLGAWLVRQVYIMRRRRAREQRKKASVLWGAGEKFNGNDTDPEAGRSAMSSWRGSNKSFPPPKVERDPFRSGPMPTTPRPALFLNPGRRSETAPVRFGNAF